MNKHNETQPTLVLIHGIGQDKNAWQFVDPASIGGANVQTYEIPGHGRTPRQPGMTWLSLADDLVARYDGALDLVAVAAPSEIVLNVLVRHPQRIRSALIVCGGRLGETETSEGVRAERKHRADAAVAQGMSSFLEGALNRWFLHAPGQPETPAMAYVRNTILKMSPQALGDAQYADLLGEPVAASQLFPVTQPVTLVGVRREQAVQALGGQGMAVHTGHEIERAQLIRIMIRNSRVVECVGTTMLHLSNPGQLRDAINDHLKWIAGAIYSQKIGQRTRPDQ